MSTSSNNYLPASFSYPPPNYNAAITWNYTTWTPSSQNVNPRSVQNHTSVTPPPPPPPPPLPYTAANSQTTAPLPPVSPSKLNQRLQDMYISNRQKIYRSRRYNGTNAGEYNGTNRQYTVPPGQYSTTLHYSRQYNSPAVYGHYMMNSTRGYTGNYYRKRKPDSESDVSKKANKKRKKPLSQNVPQRKDWSVNDAKRALMVEKDYNKRHRSQSLIIKFPDLELNRDIVSKFHTSIETVHFQQPSTPRFCFVTLNDAADPDVVIEALNKTKFGKGYLTAEFKKDRDDEINIGPEDIDPLTLYVGNLAQEVTKEDMVTTYPKQKRIDIGYAKKMKYTRYAFVTFKNVDDSIEAFQKTHASQMYSKSIIVRFRRLNGTVGMPGEPKPQMPSHRNNSSEHHQTGFSNAADVDLEAYEDSNRAPWDVDITGWETNIESYGGFIKQEPREDVDDDNEDEQKPLRSEYSFSHEHDSNKAVDSHRDILKKEIKIDESERYKLESSSVADRNNDVSTSHRLLSEEKSQHSRDAGCSILRLNQMKKETEKTDNGPCLYSTLQAQNKKNNNLYISRVEVKSETFNPTVDEASNDSKGRASSVDTEDSTRVKSEPDNEDEPKEDDDDDDDENFSCPDKVDVNNMLARVSERKDNRSKAVKGLRRIPMEIKN